MKTYLKKKMKNIYNFFCVLFLGQEKSRLQRKSTPSIKEQCFHIIRIWKNKQIDFGIVRIIRLFLAIFQFGFPNLYVRHFFSRFGVLSGKIGTDLYILIKLILLIILFYYDIQINLVIAIIAGYLLIETVLYLTSIVLLSDRLEKPISFKRSLTILFINYIEICLYFAIIYLYCSSVCPTFFNKDANIDTLDYRISIIYFSFVTSATVGYGDIYVTQEFGKFLVICQIVIFIIFIAIFFNFFASRINERGYYDKKK